MKRVLTIVATLLIGAGVAEANYPNSTGVPKKGCDPVLHGQIYVGATKMGCRNARVIAKKGFRGREPRKWNCTGVGTSFGHCHGTRKRIAHWAVND